MDGHCSLSAACQTLRSLKVKPGFSLVVVLTLALTIGAATTAFSLFDVNESIWQRRLWGLVLASFTGLALLLAAIGLYGVMAYTVTQRTCEIGIGLAIGAQPLSIRRLILSAGLRLVLVGGVIGLASGFAANRLLVSMLFQVSATDAAVYTTVSLLLVTVALLACLLPAWRASRLDPSMALRDY